MGHQCSFATLQPEGSEHILSKEAETGCDVDGVLRRRGGRPALGSGPASVESVRLEPELRDALAARAERDHDTASAVIRKALRHYLDVA